MSRIRALAPDAIDDEPDDLGPFADGVRLWSRMIALASLDVRPTTFRNCVSEGATFVRKGAPRGLIASELIERAERHELLDALGGREAVEKIVALGLADVAARQTDNGQDKTYDGPPTPQQDKVDDCLAMLDVVAWEGVPVPARDWAVRDRIIRRAVTLISGEGGIGKSILILQLACAHVLGRDWFGSLPELGSVIYLNAEDEERELHFRLAAIVAHLGTTFAALENLHLVPLAGEDALLGVPDRTGIIRSTPLFDRLLRTAAKVRPVLIALDTAADMFGGNENDRSQVRQFISLLRRLAITGNAAVLLASHPSLTGINTSSGLSGSTGWHNSVRSRMFFKTSEADGGVSRDLRELEVKKNNYGPTGEVVRMVWRSGVFVPVSAPSSMERAAAERKAENLFLQLFDRLTAQGQTFNHHPASPTYAPRRFDKVREANGTAEAAFAGAMQRLMDAGTLRVETYGRPSRPYSKLVRS